MVGFWGLLIFVGLGLYSAGSGGRIDNVCSESFVKIISGIVDFPKVKSLWYDYVAIEGEPDSLLIFEHTNKVWFWYNNGLEGKPKNIIDGRKDRGLWWNVGLTFRTCVLQIIWT